MLDGAAAGVPRYEDLTSFPPIRQDLAVAVADDVPAARVLEVDPLAGGALLRGAESSTSTAARRSARAARRSRSGSSSAPPTAR